MCNLYSLTKGQAAIREIAGAMTDRTGNLPSLPAIFPDQAAPVIRQGGDGRELVTMRWGMPSPAFALKGRKTDPGVTNVRNLASAHWRRWLGPSIAASSPSPASRNIASRPTSPAPRFGLRGTRTGR